MGISKIFVPSIPVKSLLMGLLYLLSTIFISCSLGDSQEPQTSTEAKVIPAASEVPAATASIVSAPDVKTLRIGIDQHLIETKALLVDPNFQRLIWSGLLRLGPDGKVHPDLAAFVPDLENEGISLDGKTYTFRIKDDLRWSDGGPIQAAQVLELIFKDDGATDSSIRDDLIARLDISGSKFLDTRTLVITLNEPFPELLTHMSLPSMFPTRNFQIDSFSTTPTSGPYRISEWTEEGVVLIANEAWPDEIGNVSSHQIKRIEFIPFSEFSEARQKFLEGAIDILPMTIQHSEGMNLSSDDVLSVRHDPSSVYSILINHSDEIFGDLAARRALAMNLSRENLLIDMQADRNLALEPAYSWIPTYIWGNSEANLISLASTDLLAADSWYVGGGTDGISIELLYSSDDPIQKAIAALLKKHWEEYLPVEVLLREERSEEYYADIVSGTYQLALAEWTEKSPDPTPWLSDFRTSATENFARFSDPQFDKIFESGLNARSQKDWHDHMLQASNLLMDQVVVIPMFSGSEKILVREENVPVVETMLSHWDWNSLVIKD